MITELDQNHICEICSGNVQRHWHCYVFLSFFLCSLHIFTFKCLLQKTTTSLPSVLCFPSVNLNRVSATDNL